MHREQIGAARGIAPMPVNAEGVFSNAFYVGALSFGSSLCPAPVRLSADSHWDSIRVYAEAWPASTLPLASYPAGQRVFVCVNASHVLCWGGCRLMASG